MDDPRNINAVMLAVEQEINFTIPPHALDPTGESIYVWGHLDQIRVVNNEERVDDLKTGKKTGWEMIHDYAIQLAAYTYGARQNGWPNAKPGRIIRNRGYRTRENKGVSPDGVFFDAPFGVKHLDLILEPVRIEVALIRMGYTKFGTGPHCTYCEFNGLPGCLDHWQKLELRHADRT
jgi:hypothetical protein